MPSALCGSAFGVVPTTRTQLRVVRLCRTLICSRPQKIRGVFRRMSPHRVSMTTISYNFSFSISNDGKRELFASFLSASCASLGSTVGVNIAQARSRSLRVGPVGSASPTPISADVRNTRYRAQRCLSSDTCPSMTVEMTVLLLSSPHLNIS